LLATYGKNLGFCYEGRQPMKISTRYQIKGVFHEMRGSARVMTGKVTANSLLATKGKFEKISGSIQRKIGKFQGVFGI
jgi:uncharacterized protein YjbJ (UPF0337 family)